MYKVCFKRLLDLLFVLLVLFVSSPLLLIVSVWLFFANEKNGIFFVQERPGLKGRIFKMIKFKTMTDERDKEGNLLPDEKRLTRMGRFGTVNFIR